jgi:hypothetical protein
MTIKCGTDALARDKVDTIKNNGKERSTDAIKPSAYAVGSAQATHRREIRQ